MGARINIVTDEYYHVYNRGTDKRIIFIDPSDYARFVHYLYILNTKMPAQRDGNISRRSNDVGSTYIIGTRKSDPLVKVVAFCLMPNHYHLLLQQAIDGGIALFMQRLGTGYSMYFNSRRDRNGALFQGRYKAKHISNTDYLTHLSRYIHLNPLDLVLPDWKTKGVSGFDSRKRDQFLEGYKWSSYADYIGKKNFPSVINKSLLGELFSPEEYQEFVRSWTTQDFGGISDLVLE